MAVDKSRIQEIKNKISVPMYFYNVIIPQRAEYYSDYPVDFDARPVVKCPIHDEDTPSMRFYEETNTFYCFGCKAGGDVIELHRKFTEKMTGNFPSIEDSLDFLYDFFIKGRTTTKIVKTTSLTKEEALSSQVEIMRYTKYTNTLENNLLTDTSINEDAKRSIWTAMDTVDILVSKNIINAMDAVNYIKSIVFKVIK